jgi:hypothetical protein
VLPITRGVDENGGAALRRSMRAERGDELQGMRRCLLDESRTRRPRNGEN